MQFKFGYLMIFSCGFVTLSNIYKKKKKNLNLHHQPPHHNPFKRSIFVLDFLMMNVWSVNHFLGNSHPTYFALAVST